MAQATFSCTFGAIHLVINRPKPKAADSRPYAGWAAVAEKYHAGEISRDEYDKWRYYYPQYEDTQITAQVPSQPLSDAMVKTFKNIITE